MSAATRSVSLTIKSAGSNPAYRTLVLLACKCGELAFKAIEFLHVVFKGAEEATTQRSGS